MQEQPQAVTSQFTHRWTWNKAAPNHALFDRTLRVLYRTVLNYTLINPENMPAHGPVILMINHIHWADPFMVLGAVGRTVIAMTKVEMFEEPKTRWLAVSYGCIPVHRGAVDLAAIKAATEVLKGGGAVLISPEGTRSPTHALQHAQEGLAFLATRSGATIVPAAITGTPEIFNGVHLRRARVTVTLGAPFTMDTGGARADRAKLAALTDDAMRRLAALLPPAMRGVYA